MGGNAFVLGAFSPPQDLPMILRRHLRPESSENNENIAANETMVNICAAIDLNARKGLHKHQ